MRRKSMPEYSHQLNPRACSKVFDALEEDGYFYDPLVKEVRDSFLPWLLDGVVERVDRAVNSISIVDGGWRQHRV